ncbi:flagellar hook protein FlgE [Pararhizobium mangrovi]|uniref:Flagellar hook protein FlgE n=1 Tax=Pararhizobium mangrovi TaxID=2590452 RepID=A0A506U108_9HYPH|nr:flagellar hook protein FlgE [Pararhizobium mangrovi]TPW26901.1 flagellar hook protein FlgE [Pararhizobium mangrovi]
MGLYGMMRTGVSGMNAQSNRLGTVSDNIANADTTGYKRSSAEFSSMILPGTESSYNSGGVKTSIRHDISEQGSYTYTSSNTDLAIDGEGFFMVESPNGEQMLTRAGSFSPDADGYLVNSAGYKLLGAASDADTTNLSATSLTPLIMKYNAAVPFPSSAGTLSLNLPAGAADGSSYRTSLTAYDSQGGSQTLDFTFEKTEADTTGTQAAIPNQWNVTVTNRSTGNVLGTRMLDFDDNGALVGGGDLATSADDLGGSTLQALSMSFAGTSQLKSDFSVSSGSIDGSGTTAVSNYTISSDGKVQAMLANSKTIDLGTVALAKVASPDNLSPTTGDAFALTNESGDLQIRTPETGGYGSLISGALENSNVDLASELTNMISSQRSYTANSKVFQTGSDLLNVLVNLQR